MNAPTHGSGPACLFHMAATSAPKLTDPVTCPNCLSDETKSVEQEHGIFECCNCGERFAHSYGGQPTGADRERVEVYLAAIRQKSPEADVSHWIVEKNEFFFLWMVWKEPKV